MPPRLGAFTIFYTDLHKPTSPLHVSSAGGPQRHGVSRFALKRKINASVGRHRLVKSGTGIRA